MNKNILTEKSINIRELNEPIPANYEKKPKFTYHIETDDPNYAPPSKSDLRDIIKEVIRQQNLNYNPQNLEENKGNFLKPQGKAYDFAHRIVKMRNIIIHEKEIKDKFNHLVEEWKEATEYCSIIYKMVMHPAYQKIIGLGPDAITLILNELLKEPDYWFWALESITGENPIPESSKGNLIEMTNAWLNWGRENDYI